MSEKIHNDTQPEWDTLVIKGKFKFTIDQIYGVFYILINKNSTENITHGAFASFFSDMYSINIKSPWVELTNVFKKFQVSGEFAQSITQGIQRVFDEKLNYDTEITTAILKDAQSNNKKGIIQSIERLISFAHKDKDITIDIDYERIYLQDIAEQASKELAKEDAKAYQEANKIDLSQRIVVDPSLFHVPAHPLVSPFGDSICAIDLHPGDRILMTINKDSEIARIWLQSYTSEEALKSKKNIPVIGYVAQIAKAPRETVDVLVMYNKNQYTKFNIESRVKIKTYNHETEKNSDQFIINPFDMELPITEMPTTSSNTFLSFIKEEGIAQLLYLGVGGLAIAILAILFI